MKKTLLFIKIIFKWIIDTAVTTYKWERDWKHFSKYLKSVKEYQKEQRRTKK